MGNAFLSILAAACALAAQTLPPTGDPPFLSEPGWTPLLDGRSLAGWQSYGKRGNQWMHCKAVVFDGAAAPKSLSCAGGAGDRILNGRDGRTDNIYTARRFGDVELYVEYMLSKDSNSGVYLQGLYEVQILDSFGKTALTTGDNGAIYHRWIGEKPVGGSVPKVNASRPPGEWQWFRIWFRAPRFDASGRKTENARFLRVVHNGLVVQENVEVEGPTRAHMDLPEAALNPVMLQGDHGPVAYRNIYIRPLK